MKFFCLDEHRTMERGNEIVKLDIERNTTKTHECQKILSNRNGKRHIHIGDFRIKRPHLRKKKSL